MEQSTSKTGSKRQIVVVTGASSGVGRAVARAYGQRGAHVGLVARNEEALQAAAGGRAGTELGGELDDDLAQLRLGGRQRRDLPLQIDDGLALFEHVPDQVVPAGVVQVQRHRFLHCPGQ